VRAKLLEPIDLHREGGDVSLGEHRRSRSRCPRRRRCSFDLGEVQTGAETPTGTGKNHNPARIVPPQGVHRVVQLVDEREGDGIDTAGRFKVTTVTPVVVG
jgi:hypothetical protein